MITTTAVLCPGIVVEHDDGTVECEQDCQLPASHHEIGVSCGWSGPLGHGWRMDASGHVVGPWPRHICTACENIPRPELGRIGRG